MVAAEARRSAADELRVVNGRRRQESLIWEIAERCAGNISLRGVSERDEVGPVKRRLSKLEFDAGLGGL